MEKDEDWQNGKRKMEVHFPHITNSLTVTKQRRPSPAKKVLAVIVIIVATSAGVIGLVA